MSIKRRGTRYVCQRGVNAGHGILYFSSSDKVSVIVSDPATSGALGYHSSVVLSIIIVMVAAFTG